MKMRSRKTEGTASMGDGVETKVDVLEGTQPMKGK